MKSVGIDLSRHISLQIAALKLLGLWFYIPYRLKNVRFWISVLTRIVVGIAVFVVPTASQLIYVVKLILSGKAKIQEVAGIINLIMTELLVSLRLLDLSLRRDLLMQLSDQLKREEFQFYSKDQNNILEEAVKFSRRLFWILLFCCSSDVLVHVVVVPALHNFETLPLKMDLVLIDVNRESYFNYICSYQILYKPVVLLVLAALQTLPWATMSCAISQLDVLIYNFENIKDLVKATAAERQCNENEAFKEVFKRCVLHHCSIIRFVNTIQGAFSGLMAATLCLSSGILGTTAVQIFSIESPLNNKVEVAWVLAYLLVFIGILFIDCYFGNTVTAKVISQLDVLIYNFENIKDLVKATAAERQCNENEAFKEVFKRCVLHHCSIIRFVNTIQGAFSGLMAATLCLSSGILGTTAVQIFSIESPLNNKVEVAWVLAYLLVFIGILFIDCYFGNTVTAKNLHVSTVVFSCPWIELPTNLKKNIIIFIAKTQRPLIITSAKLVPISLETFTKVMNWTYKGFAVMNQMKK